jgi:hypothetical protein
MKLNLFTLSAALALTTLTTRTLAAEPETVWLSSLDLSPITQGRGQPQADKAVTGKPLSIGGKKFERGLGTLPAIGQLLVCRHYEGYRNHRSHRSGA